jgi:ribosomal protein S12 methylthiotransferase
VGVFAFSPEEGTEAARHPGQVPEELAEERRRRLLATQQEISRQRNQARIGEILTVLLDAVDAEGVWIGRHPGQAPEVDGTTRLPGVGTGKLAVGEMVRAKIVAADAYDLEARLADKREIG